jgi:adenylate cyclase
MQTEVRAEVAQRLAASNQGWQAVALGATGHAGIKVGANSERSAIDEAMQNCALHDHDCHVVVIGPFFVQASPMFNSGRAQ